MRVPAIVFAVPLLAGASAGILLFDHAPDRLILAAAFAAVLCAIAGAGFFAENAGPAVAFCVVAGALAGGYALGASATRGLVTPPLLRWVEASGGETNDPLVIEGVLREDPAPAPFGVVLIVDVQAVSSRLLREGTQGGVRLVVGGTPSAAAIAGWRAGRRVRVPALLRLPTTFNNPGLPDARRALALRGIALVGSVKSAALVEITAAAGPLGEWAGSVRAWTRTTIARHVGVLDQRSAAVATAILIGDRTGLSEEDERRLQDAGTYHVIAISGGNIAILTALLVVGTRMMRLPYRPGAVVCIAVLLLYGEVAGGAASVGRAITAAILFLVALILDHRGAALNVVAVAAILAIAVAPVTSTDGGFLLSFGATAGIILGASRLAGMSRTRGRSLWFKLWRAFVTGLAGVTVATLCAEVALLPIVASLFSRVTFAGLIANFAAIPLMTAVQCGSLALLAAEALSIPATSHLGLFVHRSAWALVESARFVEWAPWLVRDVLPPAGWLCTAYYAACGVLLFVPPYRRVGALALFGASLLIVGDVGVGSRHAAADPSPGTLRVVILDVGQGDATLAILPDERAVLVDAGGLAGTNFDIGSRVILPTLRAMGVRRLHAMVLTHGDPDHVGGAEALITRLPVANIWEGVPVPPHPGLRAIESIAAAKRTVWRTLQPGDVERAGGVDVRVHHPPSPGWERQRVRNDDSVVLELRHGAVSILLPGDIGREVEHALIPALRPAPLVILKAAHHGSASSSSAEFLAATNPQAVIFSTGRNNRFGHPAAVVVERFAGRGAVMFNTAYDGAVFIETDGVSATVHGWQSRRRVVLHEVHNVK